jgi:hypothetical protein
LSLFGGINELIKNLLTEKLGHVLLIKKKINGIFSTYFSYCLIEIFFRFFLPPGFYPTFYSFSVKIYELSGVISINHFGVSHKLYFFFSRFVCGHEKICWAKGNL